MNADLAIVGSGGAAFAAAIHARRKGRAVLMIERERVVGGTCVNVGCIPSKALLAAADARHIAGSGRFPGIGAQAGDVDFAALIRGKDEIVEDLRTDKYVDLAKEYGWQVLHGAARFVPGPALDVDGQRIEAAHYLVATGSAPWAPPIEGLATSGFLTSTTAMALEAQPSSMIVIGGNYVGLEQGQLFSRLGVQVTVLEALDRIAPNEEPEISELLEKALRGEGIEIQTAARVARVKRDGPRVVVTAEAAGRSRDFHADALLVATGRRPESGGLGLDAVSVKVGEKGEIVVDERLRTTNPRIWAAGDVTGQPQFVYVAGAHGVLVVDNAFEGAERRMDFRALPRVTFTSPNVAAVGLTEAEAVKAGLECECRTIGLDVVPRALVNRDTLGVVKIVAERQSRIVRGVHVLAHNAGDVILAGVYAIDRRMTVDEMANLWCPYLTMSEALKLCAQAFTLDVTKLSCCGA